MIGLNGKWQPEEIVVCCVCPGPQVPGAMPIDIVRQVHKWQVCEWQVCEWPASMIYKRAEPLLTCAAPRSEGKGLHPSMSPVTVPFPKRKSRSIPSICTVSWQCLLNARVKVEHRKPTYCPFVPVFSGIDCE